MSFETHDDSFIKKEKNAARELRKTRWWQNKIAHSACFYCQKPLNQETATMDHIVPISRGGKTTKGNLAVSCKECNNRKKYYTLLEWEDYLKNRRVPDTDG